MDVIYEPCTGGLKGAHIFVPYNRVVNDAVSDFEIRDDMDGRDMPPGDADVVKCLGRMNRILFPRDGPDKDVIGFWHPFLESSNPDGCCLGTIGNVDMAADSSYDVDGYNHAWILYAWCNEKF